MAGADLVNGGGAWPRERRERLLKHPQPLAVLWVIARGVQLGEIGMGNELHGRDIMARTIELDRALRARVESFEIVTNPLPMPPTIKEVAERAQVSVSTVSRVLNDYPFVSEAARSRVVEAMEHLDYRPDGAARTMRTGTSLAVGFVVDDFANPLFSAIAKGADLSLYERGYSLVLANSQHDAGREADAIAALRQRRVDGLMIALVDERESWVADALASFRASVLLDRECPGSRSEAVLPDHAAGMASALDHLLGLGHRRIALIAGSQGQRGSRVRVEAFRAHFELREMPLDDRLVRVGELSSETGYLAMRELLVMDDPPTAIISGSNQIFVGVVLAVREHGLRVPADISLVTCDDVDVTRLHEPPIDVIGRDAMEMGRAAAKLLLGRLDDPYGAPQRAIVPTTFVRRESSAPPATNRA